MSIFGTDNIERTRVKKLALLGFDGSGAASIELCLSREPDLKVVHPEQADLLVVSGDQGKDPEQLQSFYAHKYAKPGVLISIRDLAWPGYTLLKKPYSSSDLIKAIKSFAGADLTRGVGVDDARIAAVMDLRQNDSDERTQAFDSYMSRVGAGQSAIDSFQSEKHLEEQKQTLLKEKLRRGREASKRAAEKAVQHLLNDQQVSEVGAKEGAMSPGAEKKPDYQPQSDIKPSAQPVSLAESEADAALKKAQESQQLAKKKAQLQAQAVEKKKIEQKRLAEKAAFEKKQSEKRMLENKRAEKLAAQKRQVDKKVLKEKQAEQKVQEKQLALKKAKIVEAKLTALKAAKAAKAAKIAKVKEDQVEKAKALKNAKAKVSGGDASLRLIPDETEHPVKKSVAQPAVKTIKVGLSFDDEMIYRCCGNLADVDIGRPDERRRIYFNTDGALLYWLLIAVKKARLSNTPVEIAGLPRLFVYLPEEDKFFGDFGEDLLLQYALSRFGFGELDLKDRLDLGVAKPAATGEKYTLNDRDAMIWKVALWTARGRLNQGMDPEKVYKLKTRPDFKRMVEIPHATEITELWFEHRLSALDIVRILNIPQRFVFAYMSGVDALGWLQE